MEVRSMKGQGWKRQRGPCGPECLSGVQEVLRRPAELVSRVRGKQHVEPEKQKGWGKGRRYRTRWEDIQCCLRKTGSHSRV